MNSTQNNGFEFLDFIAIKEADIALYTPIAGSFAVIECDGRILMVYNKWRKQWELPAGKREGSETEKQCAIRELYEESGQLVEDLEFKGLLKLKHSITGKIKFNPVFFKTVHRLQPFIPNEETSQIVCWDQVEEIGVIDEMDLKVLEYIERH